MKSCMKSILLSAVLACTTASIAYAEQQIYRVEVNKGQMVKLNSVASSVLVADPTIADIQVVSPRMVYLHGKKIGETSIYAIDSSDNTVLDASVEVTHNLTRLNRTLKELVPDADVELKSVDGGLVMNGFVDTPMQSDTVKNLVGGFISKDEKLVNMINTAGTDQVTLQVKVAEVSRNELKRFGIHMENLLNTGNFVFSLAQGRDFLEGGQVLRNNTDSSIYAGYNGGKLNVQSVIDALETQGLVSVLAEPSLTTTSGKTANFLAGGEYPIPLVDGNGGVSVEYKPFGISLNFTPTVLSKDKISLSVAPEVSNISSVNSLTLGNNTAFVIPSIPTRRAQTTVELGSGQTFAIAGLFKNDRSNNIDKFPGLGEVPVLGALFRSQEFQNDQSELVILVTPYLTRPVPEKMATPLDGYTPPVDLERILQGKLYHEAPAAGNAEPAPALHGDGGFMLQ